MHCPYCDQEHEDGIRFCPTTGQELNANSFCKNCGAEIQRSWKACPICGTLLDTASTKIGETKQFRQRSFFQITLSILIVVFGFATYIIYSHRSGTQQLPESITTESPQISDTPDNNRNESEISWLTSLSLQNVIELNTSNISALKSIGRLGRGTPMAIAQSPSENQIAVGTTTGISIIDLQTFKEIAYIDENSGVTSISFSPDGSQVAAGLSDGRIVVYDSENGAVISDIPYLSVFPYYIPDYTNYVVITAFSSGGRYVVGTTGSSFFDASVDFFNPDSGEKLFSFYSSIQIASLDVDMYGQYVAIGSTEVSILNANTGELVQTVRGVEGQIVQVKFSPDANSLVIGTSGNGIYIWDLGSQSVIKHISNQQLQMSILDRLDPGPDGKKIVFNDGHNIGLFNVESNQLVWLIKASDFPINILGLNNNSDMVISGGSDGFIRFLSLSDGREIKNLRFGFKEMGDIDFSPDGHILAAGHGEIIDLWKIPGGTLQAELMQLAPEGMSGSGLLAFSPNGINLAADSGGGSINLWDIRENKVSIGEYKAGGGIVRAIKFAQGGDILASAFDDPVVALQNTSDHKTIVDFPGSSEPLAVSADGLLFAFASKKDNSPAVAIYDTQSGQIIQELVGNKSVDRGISFNSNGSLIAAGGGITVWDISTATELFRVDEIPVRSLAFSPTDPWLLASSGDDGILRLWDVQNKKIITAINCNQTCQTSLVFSPDGTLIATGSLDGSIRLWGVSR